MSSKRPGTVDYSHFDNIDCSSSEDEQDDDEDLAMEERRREYAHWKMSQQGSDFHGDEEEDRSDEEHFYSDDDDEEKDKKPAAAKVSAIENLSMLQKAWGAPVVSSNSNSNAETNSETVDASESGSAPKKIKFCVACNTEDPHFKCSRCQVRVGLDIVTV